MRNNKKWFFLVALLPVLFTACAKQAGAFTVTEKIGDWQLIQSMDEMTDEVTNVLMLISSENGDHVFGLRKVGGVPVIGVYWGRYLAGDRNNNVRVRYRLGTHPVSEYINCQLTSNHQMVRLPAHLTPELLEALKTVDVLRIEVVDPSDGESIQLVFSVSRFAEALAGFNKL